MIDIEINKIFSFFSANKYLTDHSYSVDYMTAPRPFHSIAIINDGSGISLFDGKKLKINKGDVLFIPKYATYSCDWCAEKSVELFSLHFDFLPQFNPFQNVDAPIQTLQVDDAKNLKTLYEKIFRSFRAETSKTALLALFFEYLSKTLPCLFYEDGTKDQHSIQSAIDYIENNYISPVTVEYLASLCALSPSRFFTKFKKATGYSPIAYKNKVLINHVAQSLLANKEKTVEEIADEYGFNSSVYLRRLFKEYFHVSPTAYKKTSTKIL